MRNAMKLAIGLMVVAGLAASLMPAEAACGAARAIFSSKLGNSSYLYSPGNPFTPNCSPNYPCGGDISYYANGFFWAWGGGNPNVGVGHDNGSLKGEFNSNWLYVGFFGNRSSMGGPQSHWATPGTDGCITATGSSSGSTGLPDPQECMVAVLEDFNGPTASFLALSTPANGALDFEFTPDTGFPAQLNLVPIPKPVVVSATPAPLMSLTVSLPVGSLTRANGFDFKCHGAPGEILTGWRLYMKTYPGNPAPGLEPEPKSGDSRLITPSGFFPPTPPWVLISGPNPVPIGTNVNTQQPCANAPPGSNVVLCATLTFGGPSNEAGAGHWELKNCSQSSTTITCETNLADPGAKNKLGRDRGTVPHRDKAPTRR